MFVPLFLWLDLSTQQLKASVIDGRTETLILSSAIQFDKDLPHYKTSNGAIAGYHNSTGEGEITSPVGMWLEAVDVLMERLKEGGVEMGTILGVSGAAQVRLNTILCFNCPC